MIARQRITGQASLYLEFGVYKGGQCAGGQNIYLSPAPPWSASAHHKRGLRSLLQRPDEFSDSDHEKRAF
jgi:hypothetical protein